MKRLLIYTLIGLCFCACDSDLIGTDPNADRLSNSSPEGITSNSNSANESAEVYNEIIENPFISTKDEPVSTFSIDADGGAYGNTRRYLAGGQIPPADAIRTEELINYFNYDYPEATDGHPISLEGEISSCPWNQDHKLMRVGIKGKTIEKAYYPASNLVFLVDVSGSMSAENKLTLLKESMALIVPELRSLDKISIVTYASNPGVALKPTTGNEKSKILRAIQSLEANGSTNGEGGIRTAYDLAEENLVIGGNNRIIMATDGDFNVGISDQDELIELIEEERERGIFLTTIGLGTGNYKEGQMEQLADNGNGNYEYIDDIEQGRKVFVEEFNKFFTVAKDVKVQVAFNSDHVVKYRLIGYENRVLANADFEDDTKDAGEIGAGQSITALYEIETVPNIQHSAQAFTIDFRYKLPDEDVSNPLELQVSDHNIHYDLASQDHQFAVAVASFGLLMRESEYRGVTSYDNIRSWAERSMSYDPFGYKREFIDLVDIAAGL